MKKLFTLFFALVASVETMFASVTIDGIAYNLNETELTAEVTSKSPYYSGEVVIPESISSADKTYSVTSIGQSAFQSCSGLTSVTIPNSVTSIGMAAFDFCENLNSITIPNGVTSIESYTFRRCYSLTTITIPNSITSIESNAFEWCTGLINVDLGNVYTIKSGAFDGCTGLTSITIPQSVSSIKEKVFTGCTKLTTIVWNAQYCPDFTNLGNDHPFYGLNITTFTFGENVTRVPAYLCYEMENLTSINIPNSVTSIGRSAFDGCKNIASLTFGSGLQSIETYAFNNCASIKSLIIPNSVYSIGDGAFRGCRNIVSIEGPSCAFDVSEGLWTYYTSQLQMVKVTSGTLTNNGFGFINRSHKTLKSLDISTTANTTLADEAFKGCYAMEGLSLPFNLSNIGYMAIADCKNLQSISIPASVTEISQSAFENCRSLSGVQFAEGSQLHTIGNWAFYNCHTLQNLQIPEGVTSIGDGAFYGCVYLQNVSIPASVQSIGDNTFALCSKISRMDVDAVLPPDVENETFYEVSTTAPVYVPDASVGLYKSHPVWGLLNIVGKSDSPQSIDNTFDSTNSSTKILHNGQILILRGDRTYTLQGQKVK